jgi:hypothetical protein
MARSQRRTALLYDAPLSTPEDIALVKSMLLFFDDVVIFAEGAAPPSRQPTLDLRLSEPLVERGLLRFAVPDGATRSRTEVVVRATLHRAATEKAEHWIAAVSAGDWDADVPRLQGRFSSPGLVKEGESSPSRAPSSLELLKLLAQDGLLLSDESTDDASIVRPGIASVSNSILAQAVRVAAREQGWLIEPVATRRDEARVFTAILDDAVENVAVLDVVTSDLSAVTLDLTRVGLDDLCDFRARHRNEFRAHVLALQALLAPAPAPAGPAGRKAALVDEAHRLRELQRRRWPTLGAGASLGIVGATWTLAGGDLLGALIGAPDSQLLPVGPTPASAYTYLVRADPEMPADASFEWRPESAPASRSRPDHPRRNRFPAVEAGPTDRGSVPPGRRTRSAVRRDHPR